MLDSACTVHVKRIGDGCMGLGSNSYVCAHRGCLKGSFYGVCFFLHDSRVYVVVGLGACLYCTHAPPYFSDR